LGENKKMSGISVKSADLIQKKYLERAGGAGAYYEAGVKNPSRPWAAAAEAGVPNLKLAVSAASYGSKVSAGIRKAGDAKWQARAVTLGVSRFPSGIAAGASDFATGIAPYLSTLSSLSLPDRKPRGDPANQARSSAVATALAQKRISMAGAGV
jgi:hypothetical protein